MKKSIFFFAALICAATAFGQQRQSVVDAKRLMARDSLFLVNKWYKTLGNNIATANLTATGNYTHNWAGFSTVINNALSFVISASSGAVLSSPGTGSTPGLTVGISRFNNGAYVRSATLTSVADISSFDGLLIRNTAPAIEMRIGNHSVQSAGSVLSLATPATGAMAWATPAAIVSAGGGATTGQFWATGGNSSPGTTNFTLGSLTADDVSLVTGVGGNEVLRLTKTGGVGVRTSSPGSSLHVAGSFGATLTKIDMTDGDTFIIGSAVNHATGSLTYVVDFDGSSIDGNFLMPDAANALHRIILVKRTSTTMGAALNLSGGGTSLVENLGGTFVASIQIEPSQCYWFQSDGTDWHLIFFKS